VIGRPDDTRGEVVAAFALLKNNHAPSPELRQALLQVVRHELGPVARPDLRRGTLVACLFEITTGPLRCRGPKTAVESLL